MCIAAATTGAVVCLRSTNCPLYSTILSFVRTYIDPEVAHHLSIKALKLGLTPIDYSVDPPVIQSKVKDVIFFSPIGMRCRKDMVLLCIGANGALQISGYAPLALSNLIACLEC